MKKIYLVFMSSKGRSPVEIPEGSNAIIGHGEFYKIYVDVDGNRYFPNVPPDASVSRRHARIFWKDGKPYIQDLGSLNGTKIDGHTIPGWRERKREEKGRASMYVLLAGGMKILFGAQTLASVEYEKDTLTIIERQSVRLSLNEIEMLIDHADLMSTKREKGDVEILNVKSEGELRIGREKIKLRQEGNYGKLIRINMAINHICFAYYKKKYEEMFTYLRKLMMSKTDVEFIEDFLGGGDVIGFAKVHIMDVIDANQISEKVLKDFIIRMEALREKVEEELQWWYGRPTD